jgi:hypothetical protein
MRELIGYLVACRGNEEAAARMAAGIPQQFLCEEDRADRVHARIDDESIGTGIAIGKTATHDTVQSAPTGRLITIIYAREKFTGDLVEEIANAIPGLGVSDCGSRECQATGKGARRM